MFVTITIYLEIGELLCTQLRIMSKIKLELQIYNKETIMIEVKNHDDNSAYSTNNLLYNPISIRQWRNLHEY